MHEDDGAFAALQSGDRGYVAGAGLWDRRIESWDLDGAVVWQKSLRTHALVADGLGGTLGETLLRPANDPRGPFLGRQLVRFDAEGNETERVSKSDTKIAPFGPVQARSRATFTVCSLHYTLPITDGRGGRLEQNEGRYLLYDASGALVAERPRNTECRDLARLAWTTDGGVVAACLTEQGVLVEKWHRW